MSIASALPGGVGRCWPAGVAAAGLLALALFNSAEAIPAESPTRPPPSLEDTGLYSSFETLQIDPDHLAFAPQYPLWTDGATKRRWISLPPGTAIDGSEPEAWSFPVGTRFWKEFSFDGQRVETRYLERQPDGRWLYAAYMWSQDGRQAYLAPERGKRGAYPLAGGRSHTIPGVSDCKVCHQGNRTEVLGFSALQLSPDRDPGALHVDGQAAPETNLADLVEKGLLVGFHGEPQQKPPRITARSALERAALGYMHGNCGHCHNDEGPLRNMGLFLRQPAHSEAQAAIASTVGSPIKKLAPGQSSDAAIRIQPGRPDQSGVAQRMASRYPALQMPPLGTELVDDEAVSLIRQWIVQLGDRNKKARRQKEGG